MTERVINIAFRIVFHSIPTWFFSNKKFPIMLFYLFTPTCGISLDSEK
jgi:hypothetical protein